MAFFHDLPDNKKQKKSDRLKAGGWEEEGTRYHTGREDRDPTGSRYGKSDNRGQYDRQERTYRQAGRDSGRDGYNRQNRAGRSQDQNYGRSQAYGRDHSYGRDQSNSRNPNGGRDAHRGDQARQDQRYRKDLGFRKPSNLQNNSDSRLNSGFRQEPYRRTGEEITERDYRDFEFRDPGQELQEEKVAGVEYILTGRNPIREALKNDRDLEKLLVQKGELSGSAREIVAIAKEKKIMVQLVEKSRLDEIAEHHQGLIAIASAYQYSTLESILETAREKEEDPFLILLDGVTDPHNLGAVIRTAECVGAHGVIVPQHRSVGLTPAAVKASAGAVEHVKVARVTNINRCIEDLQKRNIWVYGLSMEGEDYEQISFQGGTALVIGAEGEGISRLTAEKCDQMVSIPIRGKIDSLNASVAAGIMMYRVLSCRKKEGALS